MIQFICLLNMYVTTYLSANTNRLNFRVFAQNVNLSKKPREEFVKILLSFCPLNNYNKYSMRPSSER